MAQSEKLPPARDVLVAWDRLPGWVGRFESRHPGTDWVLSPTAVAGRSTDGSTASFAIPLPPLADLTMPGLRAHLRRQTSIGIVLVRRGGFAVAKVVGGTVVESKVGQRHVQGRSKAGGWSQQRFARRRGNQAQAAFDAASGYVESILAPHAAELELLVCGGDRSAVDTVLDAPGVAALTRLPRQWLAGLPDPRRRVLDDAVARSQSVEISIVDTAPRRQGSDPTSGTSGMERPGK